MEVGRGYREAGSDTESACSSVLIITPTAMVAPLINALLMSC